MGTYACAAVATRVAEKGIAHRAGHEGAGSIA